MLQKPGERGRKQSSVVGRFLPSSLPWKCSVMERRLWSTVVHCGRGRGMLQWCTAQPARARSDGSVLYSASEGRGDCPAPPLAHSLAHHSHPTHGGLILEGLGCVRLQKHTPAVLPVPGACSGSCGRDSRPSTTSKLSTVYSNVGLALFWASCCACPRNVILQHPRPSSRHAATAVTAVLSRCHTATPVTASPTVSTFRRFVSPRRFPAASIELSREAPLGFEARPERHRIQKPTPECSGTSLSCVSGIFLLDARDDARL